MNFPFQVSSARQTDIYLALIKIQRVAANFFGTKQRNVGLAQNCIE
jgi:hypothetical protein